MATEVGSPMVQLDSNISGSASAKFTNYPLEGIAKPGSHDVLCGRGGGTNNHSGNVKFRKLVNEHKMRYFAAPKVDKPKVAREVVKIWRELTPPGRFLARKAAPDPGSGDQNVTWSDVGDKKAREKASQCLRERTPEVMPLVQQRRMQQNKPLAPAPKDGATKDGQARRARTTNKDTNNGKSKKPDTVKSSSKSGATPDTAASSSDANSKSATPDMSNYIVADPASRPSDPNDPEWNFEGEGDLDSDFIDFGDDGFGDDEPELTLEEYQEDLHEYIVEECGGIPVPDDDGLDAIEEEDEPFNENKREIMEDMKTNSWVKSFHSVDTLSMDGGTHASFSASIKGASGDVSANAEEIMEAAGLGNTLHSDANRSQKMQIAKATGASIKSTKSAQSGMSMFSEITDSAFSQLSRKSKMSAARKLPSEMSVMSELTDLSASVKNMDLASQS